jgi:hypothetical protein
MFLEPGETGIQILPNQKQLPVWILLAIFDANSDPDTDLTLSFTYVGNFFGASASLHCFFFLPSVITAGVKISNIRRHSGTYIEN